MKILTLSGSLRTGSKNTALLETAIARLPGGVSAERGTIDLPLYNADLSDEDKSGVLEQNARIAAADAVLIACPEYNYGIPGPLKNALDWASRPAYRSPFYLKPVALLGTAPGAVGTARAQGQLKQVLLGMAAQVFPHPEFLVGQNAEKFSPSGELTHADTLTHLDKYLAQFVAWVKVVSSVSR